MVNLESGLDMEFGFLLDRESRVLESLHLLLGGEIDDDVFSTLDYQCERLDDTLGVARLTDRLTGAQTERGLPTLYGFIVLVCGGKACELGVI